MKRIQIGMGLFLIALWPLSVPASASLAEIASSLGIVGEGGYGSAALDPASDIAFFGSSTTILSSSNSLVTEFQLQNGGTPFSVSSATATFSGEANITASAFDPTTGFGYFSTSSSVSGVVINKIPLSATASPPVESSVTIAAVQSPVGAVVLDDTNQFGYFGTQTSPSVIVKVRLSDLTIISSITLPSPGLDFLSAGVIETAGGFAYFASSTTPGAVAKIQLSNFTQVGTLTFNSGEGGVGSAVMDTARQLAYFGTHDNPGKVVKVSLSSLSRIGSLTLPLGQNDLTSAVIDPSRQFGYFGTNTSPGIVAAVTLSNLAERTSLTFGAGENFLRSGVIDTANGFAYFGTFTTPGQVIQVDLLAGPPEILLSPRNVDAHSGDTVSFTVSADGRALTYQWQMNGVPIAGATSPTFSRAVTAADDGSTFACVVTNANGSTTSSNALLTIIPIIRAFPNPWRVDRHAGINITFDGLLANSTVKIFNLAAHWVKTLPVASNSTTWDLTNDSGQKVASGYYFYAVTTGNNKQTVNGKIAIIH